ncbi:PleD family two-component system response regulator [Kovacikia minuta CCNUW1]|uniref:response regulator n=1 Tax=Kovacikia minuta TaxID=2931930 RepID=UPI001CCB66E8|nr:PleD family two-component system response regulator [Kovacikia minuta]UBF28375.1 PleD family two-component system response regulator [Kovacikia minuta CCNUW1]
MTGVDLPAQSAQILVVDDERLLRLMLNHAMQKDGYQLLEVSSGEECLFVCQQKLPAMVLLDAMLPGMDGFTCCAKLKQIFGEQCPPVLMITSLDDQSSVDRAFEVGAIDYVTKPIHWAVLRQRVRRILQATWTLAELRQKMERERLLMQQLEAANQELCRLVSIDSMTQLANRRCFDEFLQQEWHRMLREQAPLSLILLDIDFFKAYNDTYGHQSGDECLKKVASVISQAIKRPADLAARYGGEEFAIVLPNTPTEGAIHIARAIQTEVKALAIDHSGSTVSNRVTISCGTASITPRIELFLDQLIAKADQALYRAKLAGRDRIAVYNETLMTPIPDT